MQSTGKARLGSTTFPTSRSCLGVSRSLQSHARPREAPPMSAYGSKHQGTRDELEEGSGSKKDHLSRRRVQRARARRSE